MSYSHFYLVYLVKKQGANVHEDAYQCDRVLSLVDSGLTLCLETLFFVKGFVIQTLTLAQPALDLVQNCHGTDAESIIYSISTLHSTCNFKHVMYFFMLLPF